ncbi:MaoC family dehydratase [Rhodococcus opacus]|uniref:MaoC family dehydratase n=1 Tax=Rhodococcus opacus TaxID=37919 RepID=UPI000FFC9758|nr:MaoC family dehydratase [Rhodococcus opacus]
MTLNPDAIGLNSEPQTVTWTDRDTLLYALGVGAGTGELALVTENSNGIDQQVLPTYAVIACSTFDLLSKIGKFNWGKLLHGSQSVRVHSPLPAAGTVSVVSEISSIQDKGEGKNAIVVLSGRATDPGSGEVVAETTSTLVIRGAGGFGGDPGDRASARPIPERAPDSQLSLPTREDLALLYRLSGDRNPLHSDPWFARERAGFPKPILHGLCSYGIATRALVQQLAGGDARRLTSISARFTSPVFPGDNLTTSVWVCEAGTAVFRTEATSPGSDASRIVLDDGLAEYIGAEPEVSELASAAEQA